ncbi:MAG TPA: M23 family metallopeptidase [Acidimicrobiia bacterium]|nr:M23 family metallopeptidase [Acidimicrobiia bacterium]
MDSRERASRPVDFSRDHLDRGLVSPVRRRRFEPRPALAVCLVTLWALPAPALAAGGPPHESTTTTIESTTTTLPSSTTTTTTGGSTTTTPPVSTTTTTNAASTTTTTAVDVDDPLVVGIPVDGVFLPLPSIRFPLVGSASYRDTYGAPRDGGARLHNGTDIFAERGTPVVAVAAGVVERMGEGPDAGLYVVVRHSNGWRSAYVHLNNDSPGTDNGLTLGFGPGIEVGARVRAGTLLGWVGDSGNAEDTTPHLHFELHQPNGLRPNPYPALRAASRFREFITLDVVDYDDVELVNAELVSHLFLDGGFNTDIAIVDDHAYVGTWGNGQRCPGTGVRIIDILDPEGVSMV